MCGIAGYFGTREIPERTLARCLELMKHRGPDASAYKRFDTATGRRAYLLSTRLDIIDLDARSDQPLQVGGGWLSYNGELYNYVELRAELLRASYDFRTTSDTEVLGAVIDRHGFAGLDGCEGMWAFAHFDTASGTVTLCRDRFGEKPLFLYSDETGVYWGSETSFVFELLGRRLEPDLDHLLRYLINGYRAQYKQPATFFRGLSELQPATLLRLEPNGTKVASYYWTPPLRAPDEMSYQDAVSAVRDHIFRAVELRLRADVPLAFCMSGGVDSVSLISVAKRVFSYDVHAFTVVSEDERYDEQHIVDQAVAELGLRHTTVAPSTQGFLETMRKIVSHRAAPLCTISYFVHWLLMGAIGEAGYRISVSGSAADELFSGYYDHHLAYLYDIRNNKELHARTLEAWRQHVLPDVRNRYLQDPDLFIKNPSERDYLYLNADEFRSYLTKDWLEPFVERRFTGSLLRDRMLNELLHECVPPLLHEDDLNAMSFSIENRSPYLDRALLELTLRIPTEHLMRDGYAKALLRDAMRDIAPDLVMNNRTKVGFNASIHAVLDPQNPETRATLLADSPIFEHVRREAIVPLLDKDYLPNSESKFLFNFVNAKLFLEEYAA